MNRKASKRIRITYINIVRYDRRISLRKFKREYIQSKYHNRILPKGAKYQSHSSKIRWFKEVLHVV